MRPAAELLRITVGAGGVLLVGRARPGRGAWLCRDETCLDRARRRRAFERALRSVIAPGSVDGLRVAIGSRSGTLEDRPSASRTDDVRAHDHQADDDQASP